MLLLTNCFLLLSRYSRTFCHIFKMKQKTFLSSYSFVCLSLRALKYKQQNLCAYLSPERIWLQLNDLKWLTERVYWKILVSVLLHRYLVNCGLTQPSLGLPLNCIYYDKPCSMFTAVYVHMMEISSTIRYRYIINKLWPHDFAWGPFNGLLMKSK